MTLALPLPLALPLVLALGGIAERGVCGGVVSGRAGGWAEFVAVTNGTEPRVGVGLFITGVEPAPVPVPEPDPAAAVDAGWEREGVVVGVFEEAEVERAGLAGGITCVVVVVVDVDVVGVGVEVVAGAGGAGVGVGRGVCVAGAVYCWPSSPGAKVRVEQKPSEELIIRVRPSLDLW